MSQVKDLLQRCYDELHLANFALGEVADGLDAVSREKLERREMRRRAKMTLPGQAKLLDDLERVLRALSPHEHVSVGLPECQLCGHGADHPLHQVQEKNDDSF